MTPGITLVILAVLTPCRGVHADPPLSSYSSTMTVNSDGSYHKCVNQQVQYLQGHKHKCCGGAGTAAVVVAYPYHPGTSGGFALFAGLPGLGPAPGADVNSLGHTQAATAAQIHLHEAIRLLLLNQADNEAAEVIRKQNETLERVLQQVAATTPPHYSSGPLPSFATAPQPCGSHPAALPPACPAAPATMQPAPPVLPGSSSGAPGCPHPAAGAVQPSAPVGSAFSVPGSLGLGAKSSSPTPGGDASVAATLERLNNELRDLSRRVSQLEQTTQAAQRPQPVRASVVGETRNEQ
jgi:hypothetical protein